jgi:hypothetical protein
MKNSIKRTERGWAGHFCASQFCQFHRNTLLESENDKVIVSTVGNMMKIKYNPEGMKIVDGVESIGAFGRFFETMAFGAIQKGPYLDIDVRDEREFESPWSISAKTWQELPEDVDNLANDMHEKVVEEFIKMMEGGENENLK